MADNTTLSTLIQLSRELGNPVNDYTIQAEGNTSARIDADTFVVKASGYSLRGIEEAGFVAMRFKPVLEILDGLLMFLCRRDRRESTQIPAFVRFRILFPRVDAEFPGGIDRNRFAFGRIDSA